MSHTGHVTWRFAAVVNASRLRATGASLHVNDSGAELHVIRVYIYIYIYIHFIVSCSHKRFATGYTVSIYKNTQRMCTQIYNRIQ